MTIEYRHDELPPRVQALRLYDSVGWSVYTRDPDRLMAAIEASLSVVTAWEHEELVGLARVVGDGLTITYLQDLLVSPRMHRGGIGRQLFTLALEPYRDVRQKVLMAEDEPGLRAFYESLGFTEVSDMHPPVRVFTKFD